MAKKQGKDTRAKPKEKRSVLQGVVHIQSTFNNTIVSITDPKGEVISWASAGTVGFKGTKKGKWPPKTRPASRWSMGSNGWTSM